VGEADRPSHVGGNATRDLANLGLNVPEVGRAGPVPELFDDIRVVAEDLELNGAAGADAVRAEPVEVIAGGHKVVPEGARDDGIADVLGRDLGNDAVDDGGADKPVCSSPRDGARGSG
jgi:hypothetical protein